jgi:hypothetical protein
MLMCAPVLVPVVVARRQRGPYRATFGRVSAGVGCRGVVKGIAEGWLVLLLRLDLDMWIMTTSTYNFK